ncbi:MAG TPA: HEAT repeat domain-containing protein [Desulfobacterales bacterium]|nr:HEAT repeat domain-containing protein [Desulfobacterales bacterium]
MSIINMFKPNIERLKSKKKVNHLIKALQYKNDWNVRMSAAASLVEIGWEPIGENGIYYLIALGEWTKLIKMGAFAVEPLIAVLQDHNSSPLHCETIKALGVIKDKRAVEPLLNVLRDNKIHLREEVVKALGQIGDKTVVKPLISMLRNEDGIAFRCETIRALGSTKDKRAVEPLIDVLQRESRKPRLDTNMNIIMEVVIAMGKIKDERAITHLVSLYNVYTDYLNKKIKNALFTINTELSKFYLAILNSDENRLLEIDNGFDLAVEALYHKNNWVRRQAIWALMILRDYRAVEQIKKELNDNDLIIVSYAIFALGEIGDDRAITPLIDILLNKDFPLCNDGNGSTFAEHRCSPRSEAAVALGKIKDKRAYEALIAVFEEKGCDCLMEKSAWALGQLGDKSAMDALKSSKNHTN